MKSERAPRCQTGGQWSGRSKSSPPPASESRRSTEPGSKPATSAGATQPKAAYWSPGGKSPGTHKPPPSKAATTAEPRFKRRDSVQHTSFGVGTVIESAVAHNGEEEVTVAFPGVGIKKLLADYLKKL